MKHLGAVVLASLVALPAGLAAGEKIVIKPLAQEHWNGSRTLRFKTPEGWLVQNTSGQVELTEARGDGMRLRLVRWPIDMGLDSTHAECMLQRLAGPMERASTSATSTTSSAARSASAAPWTRRSSWSTTRSSTGTRSGASGT